MATPVVLPDLTGTYSADDGLYYMQQWGSALWWAGLSIDPKIAQETQWHRGLDFTYVFSGTIFCDGHIEGQWVDVPRRAALGSGALNMVIDSPAGALTHLRQISSTGGITASSWQKRQNGLNEEAGTVVPTTFGRSATKSGGWGRCATDSLGILNLRWFLEGRAGTKV